MSPYFPVEPEPAPYRCEGCGKWWIIPRGPRLSCNVLHAPGSCCHFGEKPAPVPTQEGETNG